MLTSGWLIAYIACLAQPRLVGQLCIASLAVLAKKCVGEDFLADATILTRNRVPITNFQRIAQLSESLSYPLANMGVIILNQDMLCLKQIEYMVYAPTKGAALSLEKEFLMQMANTEAYSV